MKTRVYFLDILRTFMIFLVVTLHSGIVYEPILENVWIVSDPVKNSSIGLIRMYLDLFIMFVMFFVSGYFVPGSLRRNTAWSFIKSKFRRIMIPWIIAVLVLIPAYKVIFLYSRGLPQEEWFTYFHLYHRAGGFLGFYADNPTQGWLWFLPVLFLFQIIYLALSKTNILSVKISLKTGVILTFAVGLVSSMVISNLNLTGWYHSPLLHFQRERLLVYFMVFLLGSLCHKLKVFESGHWNKRYYILSNVILAVALTVFTVVALNLFFNMIDPERNYYFVSPTIDRILYYSTILLSMLSFLYILSYVFRFRFNTTTKVIDELNKNSYGVYIVHMVVIGVIASLLLSLSLPAIVKFFILTFLTFILSNILVSGYRRIFRQALSKGIVTVSVLTSAVILTFIVYAKQQTARENMQSGIILSGPEVDIHTAALQGNLESIQFHISTGTDINKRESYAGSTPLITASVFGRTEVVSLLIEAGADVNCQNDEGSTALHSAAFFCHPEIVYILLENGADKNIKNLAGSTALDAVEAPFDQVTGIYEYFRKTLGPLGLKMDYEQIKKTRPAIAELLQDSTLE